MRVCICVCECVCMCAYEMLQYVAITAYSSMLYHANCKHTHTHTHTHTQTFRAQMAYSTSVSALHNPRVGGHHGNGDCGDGGGGKDGGPSTFPCSLPSW